MTKKHVIQKDEKVWINGIIATMDYAIDKEYGLLKDHAIVVNKEKIVKVIPTAQLDLSNQGNIMDAKGALITPGLIDCHTHLVFGGNRASEWEERLNGVSYSEISARGGGINSTVKATRDASAEELYLSAKKRLTALINEGVTTVEIKSGYGLEYNAEKKELEVIKRLKETLPIDISATLLAAHSFPVEYKNDHDGYVNEICNNIIPKLWEDRLFESIDVFTENIAFDIKQTKQIFEVAKKLGIPVKAHAEQLSNIGASSLVADYNGLSVDHIEHLDETSIIKLKNSGTTAVLLPMAFYFLKDTMVPPIKLLRKHGVPMAVSTDFNPGTSPFATIRMALNMACTLFSLTPAEAFRGATSNAARALNKSSKTGIIKDGYDADFLIWDVSRPVEIFYELGHNPLISRVYKGNITKIS